MIRVSSFKVIVMIPNTLSSWKQNYLVGIVQDLGFKLDATTEPSRLPRLALHVLFVGSVGVGAQSGPYGFGERTHQHHGSGKGDQSTRDSVVGGPSRQFSHAPFLATTTCGAVSTAVKCTVPILKCGVPV